MQITYFTYFSYRVSLLAASKRSRIDSSALP
jgi:hypothetical protein